MLQPHILTKDENTKLLKLQVIYAINLNSIESKSDATISLQFNWFELLHNKNFLEVLFYYHIRLINKYGVGIPYYYYIIERLHEYAPDNLVNFVYSQYYQPTYTIDYSKMED